MKKPTTITTTTHPSLPFLLPLLILLISLSSLIPTTRSHQVNPKYRPHFHFLPQENWMNDPNAPFYDQGTGFYHLFFQYVAYGTFPDGNKSWGHAVSRDLVEWERLPVALSPTPGSYDQSGVWSGAAFVERGVPSVLFTGVSGDVDGRFCVPRTPGDPSNWGQVQCLAFPANMSDSKLVKWDKLKKNPLLVRQPIGATGWRDPQVWKEENTYYMIVSGGLPGKGGAIFLYQSDSLNSGWTFSSVFISGQENNIPGDNWECSNYKRLSNGKEHLDVIFAGIDHEFKNMYITGEKNGDTFSPNSYYLYNIGDYYAPQIFKNKEDKDIIIGWVKEARPDAAFKKDGWAGMMSLPMELYINDGTVGFKFIDSLQKLREQSITSSGRSNETHEVILSGSQSVELKCTFTNEDANEGVVGFYLRQSSNNKEETYLYYNFSSQEVVIDRSKSSLNEEVYKTNIQKELPVDEKLEMHVFIDNSVIEVIVNSQVILTARIYPILNDSTNYALYINTNQNISYQLEAYTLQSIWAET
eukprot:TRINITY_DN2371_c0_g1_i1.p1 TRINITY_DN2371_c0_g1~~TRINITY_DN2371_c0_g1_i1.p1  ORF type:complete len:540 (-),score=112.24 TRINITY_DN2371_c0_g1_i1:946-2526(-)